jgi:hypothetical protein
VHDGHDLDVAAGELLVELVQEEPAVVVDADPVERRARTIRRGTRLEWCSISVTRTRSPARRLAAPHEYATRFSASVALRVKIVSREPQPSHAATRSRADSNASVASAASGYTPRWTLARWCS